MDKIDQWHLARWTKFTASESHKLLVKARDGRMFGEGAMTYIEQKALEMTTHMVERPELEETKAIMHGRIYEFPAYQAYIQETRNYSMTYLGSDNPVFLEYEPLADEVGGTPDCLYMPTDSKIELGAEIKCPKNPVLHFRRLQWEDQWDICTEYPSCYTQIQMLLMITGAPEWHSISFDDRQKNPRYKIKIIPVFPDKKFQDNLEIRLRQAIKEKYRLISKTYGIEVKNRAEFNAIWQPTA